MSDTAHDERPPEPLDDDALAVLGAYRQAKQMPSEARARVWHAVERGEVVAVPARGRRGAAWVFAAAAAAILAMWGVRQRMDPATPSGEDSARTLSTMPAKADRTEGHARDRAPSPARQPGVGPAVVPAEDREPIPPEPVVIEEPAAPIEPAVAPTPRKRARPKPMPPAGPVSPAPPVTSTLAAERELIARGWAALRQQRWSAARAAATEHATSFPNGVLVPERAAVDTIARCRQTPGKAATAAATFLRRFPDAPVSGRVRDACARAQNPTENPAKRK